MKFFFIDPEEAKKSKPMVTGPDARHMIHVLRLKKGDIIGLFDGHGKKFEAKITDLTQDQVELSIHQSHFSSSESNAEIMVAQAFLKERKMDHLIRQLTELGICKWIPFLAERSVARPNQKRMKRRIDRWRKITRESLKQCGRGFTVEIDHPALFDDILKIGESCDKKMIFWENASNQIQRPDTPKQKNRILIVLGPEGGFTSNEIEKAESDGFECVTLGPRVLKADTATVAAVTLIQYLFGDMGKSGFKTPFQAQ